MPSKPTRQRLAPEIFDLPVEKMRAGWYTDAYFNHARATLLADGRHPRVVVQVFQKNDAWLGGVDEAIAILRLCSDEPDALTIRALHDGDRLQVTTELLSIWPFRHEELQADIAAAGLSLTGSTYDATQPEYLVTAQRHTGL